MNKAFAILVATVLVVNSAYTAYLWQTKTAMQRELQVLTAQTMDDAALLYALSEMTLKHIYETQ